MEFNFQPYCNISTNLIITRMKHLPVGASAVHTSDTCKNCIIGVKFNSDTEKLICWITQKGRIYHQADIHRPCKWVSYSFFFIYKKEVGRHALAIQNL